MAGRICGICSDSQAIKRAAELIAEGLSDQKIADQLNIAGNAGRMLVSRHRRFHVEAPARLVAEAAARGRPNVQEREQLVAAAEGGDPAAAFLALNQIAADLRRVQERLERTAGAAEIDQQRLAVASLSGQQLRAAEVRARLGNLGAYGAPRSEKSGGTPFVLNILFARREPQRIEVTPSHPDDFETIPPAHQMLFPVAPAGDLAPPDVNEDADDFDEDV